MRAAYILIYSDETGSRESIKAWADSEEMVKIWRYDLPNTFYLISENSAQELSDSLGVHLGGRGRYLIVEAGENRQGRLPKETWFLLRNKKKMPKEASTEPSAERESRTGGIGGD